MMDKRLFVFSSKRSIGEFYRAYNQDFAPKAMLIHEFFDFCIGVKDRVQVPPVVRRMLLLQVLLHYQNTRDTARILTFDKSFLAYLEGIEFLQSFFNDIEMSARKIGDIPSIDTYGDYDDHLRILEEVYALYKQKMEELGFYGAYYEQDFEVYDYLLDDFESVEIFLQGVASRVEMEVLERIARHKKVVLHVECDVYNRDFFDFIELEEGFAYQIELASKAILQKTPLEDKPQVFNYGFSTRLEQVSFVIDKANEWLEQERQNVAIIVPSEDFVKYLSVLDIYRNLNYAMGLDITQSGYYKKIKELESELESVRNLSDLEARVGEILQGSLDLAEDIAQFNQGFFASLKRIEGVANSFSSKHLLEFYTRELEGLKISDNKGGKIPVYGVLETRGMSFDEIVIVDFNEERIFDFRDNDMFLNTKIRKAMAMPTLADKQRLQKHYYHQLISKAKVVHTTGVKEENLSHFLRAFSPIEREFGKSIFSFNEPREYVEDNFSGRLSEDFCFSASKLKIFFECKRRFYFSYLCGLRADSTEEFNAGSVMHDLLKTSYEAHRDDFDIHKVRAHFKNLLDAHEEDSKMAQFRLDIYEYNMRKFWEAEEKHYRTHTFKHAEYPIRTKIFGKDFDCRIDRVDICPDGSAVVMDYKFRSKVEVPKANEKLSDFQLPIYALALKNHDGLEVKACYLYDVPNGVMKQDESLEEKIELLEEKMHELEGEIVFEKCEDIRNCTYCDFQLLCERVK